MGIHQIISPAQDDALPATTVNADRRRSEELRAMEAALSDMRASFSSDLVEGRMGARHNTFQHRARIIRQLAHQLDEQRGALA